jgi:hypothetical protein
MAGAAENTLRSHTYFGGVLFIAQGKQNIAGGPCWIGASPSVW